MGIRSRVNGGTTGISVLTVAALGAGIWLIATGAQATAPPQPSTAQAFGARAAAPRAVEPPARAAAAPLPASRPLRVTVSAAGIDAPLTPLRLDAHGTLQAPPARPANLAGWYRGGTAPGARGTALVVGHVDTDDGPAAFHDLGSLKKHSTVEVRRADGRTAVFSVDAVEVYRGDDFPDAKVYGPSGRAELRLITCGGGFDRERHAYRGNVVVFAHLTGSG
ncbi:class F sortase [Streptomyces pinistramenti]|uniref:class F sortase n=1 Tax=Streptomyces pinistramenti TaxID=2884812 RepID=UPI001D065D83|nr:class F sortase [Streptomyces pinistramenti]MCB5907280.1 class F sortase [Streptomyces pinistramenti]